MVATPSTSSQTKGVVRQVIGPVLDVEFPAGKLPKILNALRIEAKNPAGTRHCTHCRGPTAPWRP